MFKVPSLDTPFETDTFTLSISDNDITIMSQINVTIVNEFDFDWDISRGSNQISENQGGMVAFLTSEPIGYPFQYEARLRNEDGTDLEFNYPNPVVDANNREIYFAPAPISGNKNIYLDLDVDDGVKLKTFTLPIYLVDDVNQEYDQLLSTYRQAVSFYENQKHRNDELLLAKIINKYLLVHDLTSMSKIDDIETKIKSSTRAESIEFDDEIIRIDAMINQSGDQAEIVTSINSILADFRGLGTPSRKLLNDYLVDVKNNNSSYDDNYLFGNFDDEISASVIENRTYSAYVGNDDFGFFTDEEKTQWVFHESYQYMQVVNVISSQCLI